MLEADPDLGRWLEDDRREVAARELRGARVDLEMGEWSVAPYLRTGPGHVGLLLIRGYLARETVLHAHVSTELLGPGDVLRPWDDADLSGEMLTSRPRWNVLSPSRLIVLDARAALLLRKYPEVTAELFARLHRRSQRLAITQAISQLTSVERRLVALMWHLAERWGTVTPDGVTIPLALSHRVLSEMIGAQRPTVSVAVSRLQAGEQLIRRVDGTWLLPAHEAPAFGPAQRPVVPARRRLSRSD